MTAPNADTQVYNIELGVGPTPDATGFTSGWFSRIRGRKVFGDNVNKQPFTRTLANSGEQVVASPMNQDKITAIADAVGWRIVQNVTTAVPEVLDYGDMALLQFHYFLLTADEATLTKAATNAGLFLKWPAGYTGAASFDTGGS